VFCVATLAIRGAFTRHAATDDAGSGGASNSGGGGGGSGGGGEYAACIAACPSCPAVHNNAGLACAFKRAACTCSCAGDHACAERDCAQARDMGASCDYH
jgi:hypothetical protein